MDDAPRLVLLLALVFVSVPLVMMTVMMGMMGGAPVLFGVVPLSILLVVGYAGYRLLQTDDEPVESTTDSSQPAEDPVERLRQRYLDGELTEEEFERRLELELDSGERTGEERSDLERETNRSRR